MKQPEINLTTRQRTLLTYLNSRHTVVPGRELAENLGVSTRTLRTAVSELNGLLDEKEISIVSVPGKGYQLQVKDRPRFLELITQNRNLFSRDDRLNSLIMTFLTTEGVIDLNELEEIMFVSRTTLENDIREIRTRISENEPFFQIKQSRDQLFFEDDEMKKRDLLIHLCIVKWDYSSEEGISNWENVLDAGIVHWTRAMLTKLLEHSQIELDDYGMVYMKVATSVLYIRNLGGHRLYNSVHANRYGREWKLVKELLDALSREWQIELEEEDYDWLANGLAQLQPFTLHPDCLAAEKARCSGTVLEAAQDLERMLKERFAIEFPGDEIFQRELLLNVKAFFYRKLSIQPQSMYSADRIAKSYRYLGEAGRYLSSRLFSNVEWSCRKGEENWLVPMLASASERKIRDLRGSITVGVISHYGMGLTQYLCDNLNKHFGTRITLVGVDAIYRRQRLIDAAPELLISTVEMESLQECGIPVVVISPAFTPEQREDLETALKWIETATLYEKLPKAVDQYYLPEGKIRIAEARSEKEVEEILKEKLWSAFPGTAVPDESLWYTTALSSNKIFIYTLDAEVPETALVEAALEQPLSGCQQKRITRVILGAICYQDLRYFPALFAALEWKKD